MLHEKVNIKSIKQNPKLFSLMSHPCPVTSIKYCVNVSKKINFARYQRTE